MSDIMGKKQKAAMLGSMLVICNALEDMELDLEIKDIDGARSISEKDVPKEVREKIKKASKLMDEAYAIMHGELF